MYRQSSIIEKSSNHRRNAQKGGNQDHHEILIDMQLQGPVYHGIRSSGAASSDIWVFTYTGYYGGNRARRQGIRRKVRYMLGLLQSERTTFMTGELADK